MGLQRYVHKKLEILVPMSLQASLQRLVLSPPTAIDATLDTLPEFKRTTTTILFSTSGTGKTRRLLDLLTQNFGMYIIAPGVPQRSSGSENANLENSTLLRPVRSNASRDTSSLQEALNAAPFKISEFDASGLCITILFARLIVFAVFRKLLQSQNAKPTPYTWIQLQVNYSELSDPFDLAWRLIRLDLDNCHEHAQWQPLQVNQGLIWCIDEAQAALETPVGGKILDEIWFDVFNLHSKAILSGTALRLSELKGMIDPWAEPHDEVSAQELGYGHSGMIYWETTNVQKINDVVSFWTLYRQHMQDIVNESTQIQELDPDLQSLAQRPLRARAGRPLGFRLDLSYLEALRVLIRINEFQDKSKLKPQYVYLVNIRTAINDHCFTFFGRHRWSTLFIEQILKQAVDSLQKYQTLGQHSVTNAARDAAQATENALQIQLSCIKDKSWAEDLYWIAIRADVFSQSSVIEDTFAHLVSEGFAIVEGLQVASHGTSVDPGSNM